jgi:predicted house-cleaning noncanonical NTP pyrophosphatase (MazG superfamily)
MDEKELAIMKEVVEKLSLLEMDLYSIYGDLDDYVEYTAREGERVDSRIGEARRRAREAYGVVEEIKEKLKEMPALKEYMEKRDDERLRTALDLLPRITETAGKGVTALALVKSLNEALRGAVGLRKSREASQASARTS